MQLKEGTTVKNLNDEKVGSVDQIVIDPSTEEVTHIVVKKGFLFPEDKVIPLEQIRSADDETVILEVDTDNLDAFPIFEMKRYISGDSEYPYRSDRSDWSVRPLIYYPPLQPDHYPYYRTVAEPGFEVVERSTPEGTVTINKGTKVTSLQGEYVGNIEEVFTTSTGKVSHLLISKGFIFTTERLVPINWVDTASDKEIRLRVPLEIVERVPAHE